MIKLREWYNQLHRITGSMAMIGVNPLKATQEDLKSWIASLKAMIKEMEPWIKSEKKKGTKHVKPRTKRLDRRRS